MGNWETKRIELINNKLPTYSGRSGMLSLR